MHTAYVSVRLGLLALLDQADMYGYQLKARFEAQTGGIWPLNIGQVYSTLERLERDGLVSVATAPDPAGDERTGDGTGDGTGSAGRSGGREQKYYAITPAGRDALAQWYAASTTEAPPPRDELVAKVLFALVSGRAHALAVITRQRTALTSALQSHRRALRAAAAANGGAALSTQLVNDALVARAEADLRWLDLCEARVDRLLTEPTATPNPAGSTDPAGQDR